MPRKWLRRSGKGIKLGGKAVLYPGIVIAQPLNGDEKLSAEIVVTMLSPTEARRHETTCLHLCDNLC